MSRTRRLRHHPKSKVSRWLDAGKAAAERRGFFLLEELGPPTKWTVYDRETGWVSARYWPETGRWTGVGKLEGQSGTEHRFRSLFICLTELLGRGWSGVPGQVGKPSANR